MTEVISITSGLDFLTATVFQNQIEAGNSYRPRDSLVTIKAANKGKMKFSVIVLALALAAAISPAQAQNAAQAAAIAQGVVGLIFGVMHPTPQCGPHDAMPQPLRPSTPVYSQPQPSPPPSYSSSNLSDDDDDNDIQPVQRHPVRHPSAYSSQSQTRPTEEDESDQPVEVRAPRTDRSGVVDAQHQPAQDNSAQDGGSTESGQVVEIPSQPAAGRYRQQTRQKRCPTAGSQLRLQNRPLAVILRMLVSTAHSTSYHQLTGSDAYGAHDCSLAAPGQCRLAKITKIERIDSICIYS